MPNTAEDIKMLAAMLQHAESEKDKDSALHLINQLGQALNRMSQEVVGWQK